VAAGLPSGGLDRNDSKFAAALSACKNDLPAGVLDKALGGLVP
jgi:hypothetical protein